MTGVAVGDGVGRDFVVEGVAGGFSVACTGIAFITFGDSSGLIVSLMTSVAGFANDSNIAFGRRRLQRRDFRFDLFKYATHKKLRAEGETKARLRRDFVRAAANGCAPFRPRHRFRCECANLPKVPASPGTQSLSLVRIFSAALR